MFLNEKLDVIWKNETLKDPTRTVYTSLVPSEWRDVPSEWRVMYLIGSSQTSLFLVAHFFKQASLQTGFNPNTFCFYDPHIFPRCP
jgi:hypothetical protein